MIYLSNWYGLNVLLDTGSLFPVWTIKEEGLKNLGEILIKKNIRFRGFGWESDWQFISITKNVNGGVDFSRDVNSFM